MSEGGPVDEKLPSSLYQMLVVTRYELLKYVKSRRLLGNIAAVVLIVGLIYIIPPSLDHPYSGHTSEELDVEQYWDSSYIGYLEHRDIINTSIIVSVNGTDLPRDGNWSYGEVMNQIIFNRNLTGVLVVAEFDFRQSGIEFATTFMQLAPTMIVICVTFFGADALVSEYQNKTSYLLFPNPVTRRVLFLGKFLASFISCLIMIALFYCLLTVLSYLTIGEVAKYLPLSFVFATLFLLACLSVAYFVSSIMKGSTGAIVLTFFLLVMTLPVIQRIGMLSGVKMWFLLTFNGDMTMTALNWDEYPADWVHSLFGFTYYAYYPEPATSVLVMSAYTIIFASLAMIAFKMRGLKE